MAEDCLSDAADTLSKMEDITMNFVFISPQFPHTYWQFCDRLRRNGIEVYLGNDLVPPEPTKPKYRFGHWV